MARRDGMPRLELILLRSASADGYNARTRKGRVLDKCCWRGRRPTETDQHLVRRTRYAVGRRGH